MNEQTKKTCARCGCGWHPRQDAKIAAFSRPVEDVSHVGTARSRNKFACVSAWMSGWRTNGNVVFSITYKPSSASNSSILEKLADPTPTIITDIGKFDARIRADFVSDMSDNTPSVSINRTKYCCREKNGNRESKRYTACTLCRFVSHQEHIYFSFYSTLLSLVFTCDRVEVGSSSCIL